MNLLKLEQNQRPVWTVQSIARTLGIKEASARVMASRYAKKGILTRLRNNLYLMKSLSRQVSQDDLFYLSNIIQTPSYISFMTALSYYGITTQITRNVIEAVSPVRTQYYEAEEWVFNYSKIDKDLYFGFIREGKFFIATKEKALLDCLYYSSMGRYSLDVDSIDLSGFSAAELQKMAKKFPKKTQVLLLKLLRNAGLKKT
ncbi:hypothetical protein KJ657_00105 [Patescibacteria group bacterium]|nr:hypothetical protein [Patescibacteria group bacterium]MBU1015480.1 hypothetical protein [Patescibacteria group bacterium]MBU1685185.1 hypothetical protein [Patescibacteria group bacterium]MBU1938596.1 hypothetical protein [Patescibacteria group bacterium]